MSSPASGKVIGLGLAVVFSLAACRDNTLIGYADADADAAADTGGTDLAGGTDTAPPTTLGCNEAPQIIQQRCAVCHSAADSLSAGGGLDLETEPLAARLVGVVPSGQAPSSLCGGQRPYLVAGVLPAVGLLLDKLRPNPPCGNREPQLPPALTGAQLDCIQRWANQLVATAGGLDAGSGTVRHDAAPDRREDPFSIPAELLGTWTGYFEAFTLESGSDAIKVSLSNSTDGSGRVQVLLGSETPPPPVVDPAAPWPTARYSFLNRTAPASPPYLEGFSYSARGVQWNGRRLRFSISGADAWQPWCSQQPVFEVEAETGYSCLPGSSVRQTGGRCFVSDARGDDLEVSCARALMCNNGYCVCYGNGCVASDKPTASFDMTFDAAGVMVAGTALGGPTIRLTKTP